MASATLDLIHYNFVINTYSTSNVIDGTRPIYNITTEYLIPTFQYKNMTDPSLSDKVEHFFGAYFEQKAAGETVKRYNITDC